MSKETVKISKKTLQTLLTNFYDVCSLCNELNIYEWKEGREALAEAKDWTDHTFGRKVSKSKYDLEDKVDKNKQNVEKAIQLLKDNNITELEVCNFGIYYQYELSGEKISCYVLDDCELEDEELVEELFDLLKFINEKYIFKTLKFPDEGQNTLILKQDGFTYKTFSI
jgi:hypothetical protein